MKLFHSLLALSLALACCGVANATSGWDRYEVKIGGFVLQGDHGMAAVHRLGPSGMAAGKPVLTGPSPDADGKVFDFPWYAETTTHVLLKFESLASDETKCYALRKSDALANGPMSPDDFAKAFPKYESLRWKQTKGPSALPLVIIFVFALALQYWWVWISILAMAVLLVWVKRRAATKSARASAELG